jgi:hypothetical protein
MAVWMRAALTGIKAIEMDGFDTERHAGSMIEAIPLQP